VNFLEKLMVNSYQTPPTIIVNNYVTDSLGKQTIQSQVSQTQPVAPTRSATPTPAQPTYTQAEMDKANAEIAKMRKEAENNLKKEGVEPPKQPKAKKQKKGKESKPPKAGSRAEKKATKQNNRRMKEANQYNRAVEDELRRMRRQQAVTSTALVGAVTANAVVSSNNNNGTANNVIRDTVIVEKVTRDTIIIRDTIMVTPKDTVPPNKLQPTAPVVAPSAAQVPELRTARIFFASGSAVISKNYTQVLNKAAAWMLKNPDKKVMLNGVTDATGSPELNKKLAQQRINAVKKALEQRGIDVNRFEQDIQVSKTKTTTASSTNRRVEMKVIH
jgi:outer membrane protein OmpA-like peptidoglycan-associated protein